MQNAMKMVKAVSILQKAISKRDVPVTWIHLLILVADAGEKGITAVELTKEIGIVQGIVSRTVKVLSTYYNPTTKQMEGAALLFVTPDPIYRHRYSIILTTQGKKVMKKFEEALT